MDFLSTPLPQQSGSEETVVKKRYGWNKGLKKNKVWQERINNALTKRVFQGKTVNEWINMLGGDKGEIRKHIKNGTMLEYTPYRKHIGLKSIKNKHFVKQIMTPKGIMTYEEAKKAFGWRQAETVRNRVRSDNYPDWYELKGAAE
jgi:hypothetical protein